MTILLGGVRTKAMSAPALAKKCGSESLPLRVRITDLNLFIDWMDFASSRIPIGIRNGKIA